jgi:hypothetical protein
MNHLIGLKVNDGVMSLGADQEDQRGQQDYSFQQWFHGLLFRAPG